MLQYYDPAPLTVLPQELARVLAQHIDSWPNKGTIVKGNGVLGFPFAQGSQILIVIHSLPPVLWM